MRKRDAKQTVLLIEVYYYLVMKFVVVGSDKVVWCECEVDNFIIRYLGVVRLVRRKDLVVVPIFGV